MVDAEESRGRDEGGRDVVKGLTAEEEHGKLGE